MPMRYIHHAYEIYKSMPMRYIHHAYEIYKSNHILFMEKMVGSKVKYR